jgi:hypothetical protein
MPLPSKLRESAVPDGYSSSSTAASDYKPKTAAKPVKKYIYTRESSDEKLPRVETRAPRRRSPSPERPSNNAAKLASLASLVNKVQKVNMATRRPSASHSNSSRTIPIRPRSPERAPRREQERERDYARDGRDPLYGERAPRSPREHGRNVAYSKAIRDEDIIYSNVRTPSGRRERERERDSYGFPQHPGLQRGNTMPISAGSQ